MGFIIWIIVGALAGWIASMIMGTDAQMGALANIVVGVIGSGIGGWLASFLLNADTDGGLNIPSILVAIGGSCLLLFIVNKVTGRG